ncbi:hypothetical protein IKF23_00580 [Candidatus Saccharibacteria bacterium]|nr:hypothetical protein [Candidatus Saccharibacteria bacterium]
MKTSNRTLLVSEIVNLTEREMWTYGTSGELVRLRPTLIKKGERLSSPREGAYYIADANYASNMIAQYPCYAGKIIVPMFIGSGKFRQKIYRFLMPSGMNVRLITDDMGHPGSIIQERDISSSSVNSRFARTVSA